MRRGSFPLEAFPAWCSLNDVSFIDVKVVNIDGKGYGLVAERDLMNDEDNVEVPTLISIPKDLVLSVAAVEEYAKVDQNFRQLFEAAGHKSIRGDMMLFLLAQLILSSPDYAGPGVVSPWTQYFSILPNQVPIPTMWTERELSYLRGTSLEHAVAAKLKALTDEFNDVRAKANDMPYWYEILWENEYVTIHDWVLLDALYRSRSLELPRSRESMVPCLDLANHSREPTAYFEEDTKNEVTLLLRKGCSVSTEHEITIDYGQEKSAAEMLFSYGFIDAGTTVTSVVLHMEPMDDDPLAKAKLHVFGAPPTLRIEDAEDGVPNWSAPFVYLMCLNEEDGLRFGLLQETDGTRQLKLFWQEEDVTDIADTFHSLIRGHELRQIFELRAVTVVLERLEQQLESLKAHVDAERMPGLARAEMLQSASHLRRLELDLLGRTARVLEARRDNLLAEDSVVRYLGSMEVAQDDNLSHEEDFS